MKNLNFKNIKRSTIIIILALVSASELAAQIVHDSVFVDNYFHSVFFTDPDNGYIAGDAGAIYRTTDGGCNWAPSASGLNDARLLSVFFTSMSTGYAAGRDYDSNAPVLLKTLDGGTSWNTLDLPASSLDYISDLHFLNDSVGYACGDFNTIMKTSDGGSSWQIQTVQSSTYDPQYNDIFFLNTDTGFAVSGTGSSPSTLARTYDGGVTWWSDTLPQAYSLSAVQFINDSVGYVGGFDVDLAGVLLATADGGSTWVPIAYGSNGWIADVQFTDAFNGYISATNGVLHTADGGVTWTTVYNHQSANDGAIFITGDGHWHLALSALDFFELPPGYLGIAATSRSCSTMGIISRTDLEGIQLYPNPTSDVLHLVLPPSATPAEVRLYDASGKLVHSSTIQEVMAEIRTAQLRNGLYSMIIRTRSGSTMRKVSVIR